MSLSLIHIWPLILVVGIITFAYSTILGWSYYGERCCEYLFGAKGMLPYKLAFILVIVIGPVLSLCLLYTSWNRSRKPNHTSCWSL